MLATPVSLITSLYVHVPFCAQKCRYCAFFSQARNGEIIQHYVQALLCELEMVAPVLKLKTVFFGGGTPSLLDLRQWEQIFQTFQRLGLVGAAEWTIECNPATVSMEKARLWRAHGVNRVSLGVQSFEPALLECLGRIHTREMARNTFNLLRRAGFDNINLDLMFGIPGQSLAMWRNTLVEALALGSEHLSCYELIYEEDTAFFEQLQAERFRQDEDLVCAMYEELLDRTAGAGLEQYEVANFARADRPNSSTGNGDWPDSDVPARACRHNVNYWRGRNFYGLGPSATSYIDGLRTKNVANIELYCQEMEQGRRAFESQEQLPPLQRAGETAAFGLRMNAGWPLAEFQRRTGYDLTREWKSEVAELAARGWGRLDKDRFCLTRQGLRFADAAAQMFLKEPEHSG